MKLSQLSQSITVNGLQRQLGDGYGNDEVTPVLKFQTKAMVEYVGSQAMYLQGLNAEDIVCKITYRYVPERVIEKNDQIVWNGEIYVAKYRSKFIDIDHKRYWTTTIVLQNV